MAGSHPLTAPPEFGATLYFVGFLHVPILRDCPGRRLSPVDCRPAPADKQTAPSPIPPNAEFPQNPNSPAACPGGTRRAAPCTRCGASSRPRPAASAGPSSGCCMSASSGRSCRASGAPLLSLPSRPALAGMPKGPPGRDRLPSVLRHAERREGAAPLHTGGAHPSAGRAQTAFLDFSRPSISPLDCPHTPPFAPTDASPLPLCTLICNFPAERFLVEKNIYYCYYFF